MFTRCLLRCSALCCVACAIACAGSAPPAERAVNGPESAPPRPAELEIPEPTAEGEVGVIETSSSDPLDTDVPELGRVLCTVQSRGADWLTSLSLRVAPEGPKYASVSSVDATLQLSARGPKEGARMALEADGFALRGYVSGSEIVLTPSRASLWGVVAPKSRARLKWVASSGDRPEIALSLQGAVKPPGDRAFKWRPRCEELSLSSVAFDARSATGAGKAERRAWVGTQAPFSITSAPGSGDSLLVQAPQGDYEVEVHGSDSGHVKILIDQDNHLLFGWTDAKNLRYHPLGAGKSVGYGSGRGSLGRRIGRTAKLRCPSDVEIVAVYGEEPDRRAVVGVIRAGTEFWIAPSRIEADLVGLAKLPSWLVAESDATLMVASELGASCAVREP